MENWNTILLVVGVVVLSLGSVSAIIRRVWISSPMVAFAAGVVAAQFGLEWIQLESNATVNTVFEEAVRITLALGLMEVALRIPNAFVVAHWRQLAVLIFLLMLLMWGLSAGIAWAFFPVGLLTALLLGAILTPTDPVLASSIVSGAFAERELPARMRHRISFESGSNDGLGLLFVALPLLLMQQPAGEALREWLMHTLLWSIALGSLVGAAIGGLAGGLLHWVEVRGYIERASYLAHTVALTLTVLGAARLLHADGILAVFVAGIVFTAVLAGSEEAENEFVQEAFNQFFLLPVFVFFGAIAPWQAWWELGWKGGLFVVAVLLLRRIPAVLLLRFMTKPLQDLPSLLFFGWFGPLGIAALFYALHASRETGDEWYWHVASLAVFVSIFAHGISAPILTHWYGRRHVEAVSPHTV